MYLKHLSITGFRGIGAVMDLPLTQRTILYGPNGCGKTSIFQSIAWVLYGKLPSFSGGVFSKEDALVNDFLEEEKAEVVLTLSDNQTIIRQRSKQDSTSKGTKSPLLSFQSQDPQDAIQKLLGLSPEEFFTAVFLHQETIRDFLTTTPEKRSATIDRMIGTSLLRTLIKQVDPKIPNKVIEDAQERIVLIDRTLSQASVLNREMIEGKKMQYGDPGSLSHVLVIALQKLSPILTELGMHFPTAKLDELNASLSAARQMQLERVSILTKQAGDLRKLEERYVNAAETNWLNVHRKKTQFGNPTELPGLLQNIDKRLVPIMKKLGLLQSGENLTDLESSLESAHKTQPVYIGQLSQKVAALEALKTRYQQAAVIDWQGFNQRKLTLGDTNALPTLLKETQKSLTPILELLELPMPPMDLSSLEASLVKARQVLPGIANKLERQAGEFLALKESYLQTSQEVVDEIMVPEEMTTKQGELKKYFNALSKEITILTRQRDDLHAKKEQAEQLRAQLQSLPVLKEDIDSLKKDLARLEAARKQGELYNQVRDASLQYLQQAKPDYCPTCQQSIPDIEQLLERLRSETPADVAQLQREHNALIKQLTQKQARMQELESQESRFANLEEEIANFPPDLETQITYKQNESEITAEAISAIQIEISQIVGRIQQAVENRRRLQETIGIIETALGKPIGPDLLADLDLAATAARQQASILSAFDFQPIANRLEHARKLFEMEEEEKRLSKQLKQVLVEVKNVLDPISDEDIPGSFENAITALRDQIYEIQMLDFQPVTSDLARAKQLQLIQNEEDYLNQQLKAVEADIRQVLKLSASEADLKDALENAISEVQAQAAQVNDIDLLPVEIELQRAGRLVEILDDEAKLRDLESNYLAANREKTRLNHQIRRLTELRDALQDIAETTKRHQSTIVSGVLNNLDIQYFYRQLDPHPAYTNLQIEPELTEKGTYNYWIKALTGDYTHGTYVQTRFSTAQANCAAIAIFLAVNQHLSKTLETILLDDPSQFMDPDHKQRLAQTLASNPRQVIVATEDPQMYAFLRNSFASPTIYELNPWSVEGSNIVVSS
jgi:DNA repair exonuclease SbcCD ATPase subunit